MTMKFVILPGLLVILFASRGQSLVCYDNVVADELVFIECNFQGAVCAVTNMTTRTTIFGIQYNDSKLLYHCALKPRLSGPLNFCSSKNESYFSKDVHCKTWSCDTDKCNVPPDSKMNVATVPANKALSCYQEIGLEQKKVRCMFEDAHCFFWNQKDILGDEKKFGQFCATKKLCDSMKRACNVISKSPAVLPEKCIAKCCKTAYCNPLPWGAEYEKGRITSKESDSASLDFNPRIITPFKTPATHDPIVDSGEDRFDFRPTIDNNFEDHNANVDSSEDRTSDDYTGSSAIGGYTAAGVVVVVLLSALSCFLRWRRVRTRHFYSTAHVVPSD